jgi:gliding motility-associated-like protein
MNKRILSLIFSGLFFFGFSQSKKSIDSLSGFDYVGAMEHAGHMNTDKEKKFFLDHAKRTYKISKYDLYHTASSANAKPPSGNSVMQGPQPAGCNNVDFESGNTTGWTVTGDNQIMTGGTDPYGGFPRVFPGGTASLRLNDDNTTGKTTFSASATRVIPVSPTNNQFQLHFAFCLLNFPHPGNAAANFGVQFFNSANQPLACPQFSCYYASPPGQFFGMPAGVAQNSSVQGQNIGFQSYPVTYVPWQTISMDLSAYNGQNITVKITCNWCLYNYDWAYCYIDADCASYNFNPSNNPCGGTPQNVCGPVGMQSYTWTPPAGGGAVSTTSCINATVPGVYTLQCTPYTTCAALQTYTFFIGGASPTANFVFAPACIGSAASFTSTSLTNGGVPIASYVWDWGDGSPNTSTTTASTTHTFTTGGPKQVKLVVTNQGGCKDSITIAVTPVNSPVASFAYTTACVNQWLYFNNTSNLNGGPAISTYSWNWNDASVGNTTANTSHIYTSFGTKTVNFSVTNSAGCSSSTSQTLNINPSPLVDFTNNTICQGVATNFNNTTNANGSTISNWYWDFDGNGTTDNTGMSPSYIFPSSGTFTATLIGVTDLGCSDSIAHVVNVYSNPVAKLGYSKTCIGFPTFLSDMSYVVGPNGTINSWSWDFNNSISSIEATTQNATANYSNFGWQTVNLIVSTTFGCSDSTTGSFYVNPSPNISFITDVTSGCEPLSVQFTNMTTIPSGTVTAYQWSVGDNASSTAATFNHVYNEGLYDITLTAMSDSGCVASQTFTNYIQAFPTPIAHFTVSPQTTTIIEPLVEFTNVSEGPYNQFWWYFGDKGDADTTTRNPTHLYDSDFANEYTTTLIIRNQYGCADTVQQLVVVEPNIVLYIPNAFTPNGDGLNDVFQAKGYYIEKFDMWIFDRWGEQIFHSEDLLKGWDGMLRGKMSENGTYTWRVIAIDAQKKRHLLTGHVMLIK